MSSYKKDDNQSGCRLFCFPENNFAISDSAARSTGAYNERVPAESLAHRYTSRHASSSSGVSQYFASEDSVIFINSDDV